MEKNVLVIGLGIGLVVASVLAGASFFEYQTTKSEYKNLEEEYEALEKTYNETVTLWQNKYNNLQQNYSNLQSQYNSLQNNYNKLQSQYNTLLNNYSNLQNNYNSLQNDYNTLQNQYNYLQTTYNNYVNLVNMRQPSGSEKCKFITPDDNSIKTKTASILGSKFDGDLSLHEVRDLNDWVFEHIDYNYDIYVGKKGHIGEECWQYPNETLKLGHGDCEDKALLLASMCLSQQKVGWLYCAEVELTKNGEKMGHVCIFINVEGDKLYIVDPTWRNTDFPYDGGWHSTEARIESSALDEYRKENDFDSIRVKSVFNMNIYKSFSNNEDFYNWF